MKLNGLPSSLVAGKYGLKAAAANCRGGTSRKANPAHSGGGVAIRSYRVR